MEFAILGRNESARCQYTHKKTECFRVQIPTGSPEVVISADALMQEIRKEGIRVETSAAATCVIPPQEDVDNTNSESVTSSSGKTTRIKAKPA